MHLFEYGCIVKERTAITEEILTAGSSSSLCNHLTFPSSGFGTVVLVNERKNKHNMITKTLTGLFLLSSATCLALCAYKRMQCKQDAPQKANTDQPPHDEPPKVN